MDYYQRTHALLNAADAEPDRGTAWFLIAKAAIHALLAVAIELSEMPKER